MSKHLLAVAAGAIMSLAGWVRLRQPGDEIFRVQQWTLVVVGLLLVLFGWLAGRRPRNAGFMVVLASMACLMSGLMALPLQESWDGLPNALLGAAGMATGIYCMTGTRTGDR